MNWWLIAIEPPSLILRNDSYHHLLILKSDDIGHKATCEPAMEQKASITQQTPGIR